MASKRMIVTGITQGVGFRPFIYRLARKHGLRGYVANLGGSEVEILLEGPLERIEQFINDLHACAPPPARIDNIYISDVAPRNFEEFRILPSMNRAEVISQIPPDFAICKYCLEELLDPNSRFYMYPFHSCAWCGPRFSMMKTIPYDRENTSMSDFPLCDECQREYKDPDNIRRFHAQGISCPKCGPKMWLVSNSGEKIDVSNPIKETAKLIDEGYIVAIKGIGGFHIATLATDDDVVLELRRRKKRPQKPFAIMALDIDAVGKIVYVNEDARNILLSPQRPIVLLQEKEDSEVSRYVAPGLDKQGVMVAYSGIHYILLSYTRDKYLIMTSGNRKNKPICTSLKEALEQIGDFVDYFLVHNRKIINRVDDSVVRFTDGKVAIIRRARGFAPAWIEVPSNLGGCFVALGAELQNAGAIGIENKIILTQFLGDMDDLDNIIFLENALNFLIKSYRLPLDRSIFVADMHPSYTTRRIAEEWSQKYGAELLLIQHHKAHIGSVAAERGVKTYEKIVGIAIDGVGYGEDGYIWGGEVFYGALGNLKRVAHLEYQPMPGGDMATRYPIRMLVGILSTFLDDWEIIKIVRNRRLMRGLRHSKELNIVLRQARHNRCMRTSSMGRVLDSVSAYLGICMERTYEGEPAIKLEAHARGGRVIDSLEIKTYRHNEVWIIDTKSIFEWILGTDADSAAIAKTVQYCLGLKLGEIASKYLRGADRQYIFVSGGAGVNDYIIRGIRKGGEVDVALNNKVPLGDGGIALGQIYLASAMRRNE